MHRPSFFFQRKNFCTRLTRHGHSTHARRPTDGGRSFPEVVVERSHRRCAPNISSEWWAETEECIRVGKCPAHSHNSTTCTTLDLDPKPTCDLRPVLSGSEPLLQEDRQGLRSDPSQTTASPHGTDVVTFSSSAVESKTCCSSTLCSLDKAGQGLMRQEASLVVDLTSIPHSTGVSDIGVRFTCSLVSERTRQSH